MSRSLLAETHAESETRPCLTPAAEDSKTAPDTLRSDTPPPQVGEPETPQDSTEDAPAIRAARRRGLLTPATGPTPDRALSTRPLLGELHRQVALEPRLLANLRGPEYRTEVGCAGYIASLEQE